MGVDGLPPSHMFRSSVPEWMETNSPNNEWLFFDAYCLSSSILILEPAVCHADAMPPRDVRRYVYAKILRC